MSCNVQLLLEISASGWQYLGITTGIGTVGGEWRVEKAEMKQKELENLLEEKEQENEWLQIIVEGKNEKECLELLVEGMKEEMVRRGEQAKNLENMMKEKLEKGEGKVKELEKTMDVRKVEMERLCLIAEGVKEATEKEKIENEMLREEKGVWEERAMIWKKVEDVGEWWIMEEYLKDRPRMEVRMKELGEAKSVDRLVRDELECLM